MTRTLTRRRHLMGSTLACVRTLATLLIAGLATAACDSPAPTAVDPSPQLEPAFSVGGSGGLFAWWPADGDAVDIIGGNHGTLYGGAGYAPGKFGQAFDLSASNAYVMGTAAALPQGSAPRTLHAWVYQHQSGGAQTVFSYGTFATNQRAALLLVNGRLYFVGENNDVSGNQVLPVKQWHQVAITISGGSVAMYVNGVLDRAANLPRGPHNTTGTTWTIGAGLRGGNYPEWFNGLIDDVAVYDRALSAAEIATAFADGPLQPDSDGDGLNDESDNCPAVANPDQADLDGDGAGDACDPDLDGDGVVNGDDAFPTDPSEWADTDGDGVGDNADEVDASDTRPTIIIGSCDSGVANSHLGNGTWSSDLIAAARTGARNHGAFVSAVSSLADGWKKAGLIMGREQGAIVSCAAQSR